MCSGGVQALSKQVPLGVITNNFLSNNVDVTFDVPCVGSRPVALYADEGLLDAPKENAFKSMFWEGGTQGDAFLTAAAAQVATDSAVFASSLTAADF